MERTPEVEQVLRIVREVVGQRFRGDSWIFHGALLMQTIEAAVDQAKPGQVLNHEPDAVVLCRARVLRSWRSVRFQEGVARRDADAGAGLRAAGVFGASGR